MKHSDGSIWPGTTKTGKNVWFIEVRVGTKPNGKPKFTRRQAPNKSAAIKIRQDLNTLKNQGKLVQRANITIAEFGRFWCREVKPNTVKQHTVGGYEWLLSKYVNPYIGRRKMADLTYPDVIQWRNNLQDQGLGTSTINAARGVLAQLCKQACREGIMSTNPVALTDKIRKAIGDKTQVREPWSLEEAQTVLRLASGSEMDLFIHICLHLGLRHGEALGLTWKAIDFDERTIHVKYTLKDERRIKDTGEGIVRLRLQEPKTQSSIRTLTLTDTLEDAISRHQMRQSLKRIKAGDTWQESGMVFTTSIGTGVSQPNNLKRFKEFLTSHSLRYIRIHDMRHTYGTLSLENGTPLEQVSQSMGHADIGITKKIYAPDVRGYNESTALAMEAYLNPDITVPLSWSETGEELTQEPLVIQKPVPLSKRPTKPSIGNRRFTN